MSSKVEEANKSDNNNTDGDDSDKNLGSKMGDIIDVTIHPLVLLSAADHYHRVARGTRKRVVGILLGGVHRGHVDATNSFALPFEEDSRNPQSVFYLDHNYLESMLHMFRKVNAKERVVGFYSTGPQIRSNDLRIYDIVSKFLPTSTMIPPLFCIIDIRPDRKSLPTTAYKVVEEVSTKEGQRQVKLNFAHVPSQMGALEAEEVGVEHLLRDINDPTVSTVASLVKGKMAGLATLAEKLLECQDYLQRCCEASNNNNDAQQQKSGGSRNNKNNNNSKAMVQNPEIVANLQTILNLLPNLNQQSLIRSMIIKTNDMQMAIYLSALIRSVLALHDLVNNRIRYGEHGTELEQDKESNGSSKKHTSSSKVEEEKKEDDSKATTKTTTKNNKEKKDDQKSKK